MLAQRSYADLARNASPSEAYPDGVANANRTPQGVALARSVKRPLTGFGVWHHHDRQSNLSLVSWWSGAPTQGGFTSGWSSPPYLDAASPWLLWWQMFWDWQHRRHSW